jgi:pyruvate dehydrogenase E2 component (dihydrolipoamide acetyltransferase)
MPQLGETVTEGTITRWLKQVGDHVEADEPLFEVSTDKVDSEVPAPVAGVLSEIRVPEGETADVGTVLAVLAEGESQGAEGAVGESQGAEGAESGVAAPAAAAAAPTVEPEPEPAVPAETPPEPVPVAAAPAETGAPAEAPAPVMTTPPPPPPVLSEGVPGEPAPAETPAAAPAGENGGRLTSPVVRRLMNEYGLDPGSVQGTG